MFAPYEKRLLHFIEMSIIDKLQPLLTRLKNVAPKAAIAKYNSLIVSLLLGYIIADLTILYFRPMMLPTQAPPIRQQQPTRVALQNFGDYEVITKRNIFNEDGKIPPALGAEEGGGGEIERPAVLSQLPIQLLGTIVHFNPKMSIATVSLTSKGMSSSYKVDEEIEGMARVTKIERKRLTFMNLSARRPEYIEIPEESALSFGLQTASASPAGTLVEQKGKFDFAVKRTDLESLTSNLSSVLQQARMEPVFSPDGIGIEGFRFVNIQAGSPFEKLGFKIGDMIRSVNGEPVNSPTKAMEMYNLLKSSNSVQLGVERDGRDEKFNYSIQ